MVVDGGSAGNVLGRESCAVCVWACGGACGRRADGRRWVGKGCAIGGDGRCAVGRDGR